MTACNRRAFTLFQLLVILALVAILFALALPTLAKARLAAVRRQVVIDMRRRGFSHAEVAEALGISRGRAQQISQGKGLNPQDPSALF